jgi:hypothetical protein
MSWTAAMAASVIRALKARGSYGAGAPSGQVSRRMVGWGTFEPVGGHVVENRMRR